MTYGIFIGRFQPAHTGHLHALSVAASQVGTLLILIGSANRARSIRNPWTYSERVMGIRAGLRARGVENVQFAPLNDYKYNDDQWITDVRTTVEKLTKGKVIFFGHTKDGNNYLNWFPEWKYCEINSEIILNATQVRQKMFDTQDRAMPATVLDDYNYYEGEKQRFANYPFPETLNFNCADAVVVCQGKVLLIKRKHAPGRDCWALPGGFKNRNETFLDCAMRELVEETNIRVPLAVLYGSIKGTQLFDDPNRNYGIPRNTLAVYVVVKPDPDGKPPRANGCDDASETKWVDIMDALNNYPLFDDHSDIISKMTGTQALPAIFSNMAN